MNGFDAELYLRLCGERSLLSRENVHPFSDPLVERARALLAVDAIPTEIAGRVVEDYGRARAMRGIGHSVARFPVRTAAAPNPPAPRRVVHCGRRLDQPWGQLQVRYISFGATDTRFAVRLEMPPVTLHRAPRGPRGRHPYAGSGGPSGGPPTLSVTDDRGTTATTNFYGGGSEWEWRGYYTTNPPLAADTAWIEIDGERLDLAAPVHPASVRVESLADLDPAQRYLNHLLETFTDRHNPRSLDDALDALIACGALAPDSAVITDCLAVAAALRPGGRPPPRFGAQPTAGSLPAPWGSLLASRGRGGGPTGAVLIAADTPVFDQIRACVLELDSGPDAFSIDVELVGTTPSTRPFATSLEQRTLTYTAADDRGHHYLGTLGNWGTHDEILAGQVEFWPALDPRATRLQLTLTADHSRAVIEVPLPRAWEEPA